MPEDRSKPPPGYALMRVMADDGGYQGKIEGPGHTTETEATAACWAHRDRIVNVGTAYERGRSYRKGREEERAEWLEAGKQTLVHEREQQALGIEMASVAMLAAAGLSRYDAAIQAAERALERLAEKVRASE